jgi:5'-nucleotidase
VAAVPAIRPIGHRQGDRDERFPRQHRSAGRQQGGSVVLKDPANAAGTTCAGGRPIATLIKQLRASNANSIVGAGDMVGASPVTSTLTHDEATVDILNQIGLEVTSVGNHEFDHGKGELQRLQNGGCYTSAARSARTPASTATPGRQLQVAVGQRGGYRQRQDPVPGDLCEEVRQGLGGLHRPDPEGHAGGGDLHRRRRPQLPRRSDDHQQLRRPAQEGRRRCGGGADPPGRPDHGSTLNDQSCPNLSGDILPIVDALGRTWTWWSAATPTRNTSASATASC